MSDNTVSAETRESFGKGAARKLRAAGKIPAVLYGHGTEPQHLTLPGHEVSLLVRRANAVLDLDIAGAKQLALVKDIQRDPVRQIIEHIDLIVVRRGEKVQVDVPVHLEGETFSGTSALLESATLALEVEATDIPERVVVDVEGLEDGTQVTAKDVTLPAGAALVTEPDTIVVVVSATAAAAGAEGESEAEPAESASAE